MSRFSKAEAEALGWKFYHDSDEVVLRDGDNQLGITKVVPKSIRAEKYVDLPGVEATRTTEEANSLGLLLERIHSFEEFLASRAANPPQEPDARKPDHEDAEQLQEAARLRSQNEENEKVSGEQNLEGLTVAQLKELAEEKGIEAKGRKSKIIAAIKAAI